mmetsp:Transcript_16364/g.33256  ORF Transcript_16364/g.33256 Transcript_16364/m.33256 type:complete len:146 (-) Transcript_16364:77-514(-)
MHLSRSAAAWESSGISRLAGGTLTEVEAEGRGGAPSPERDAERGGPASLLRGGVWVLKQRRLLLVDSGKGQGGEQRGRESNRLRFPFHTSLEKVPAAFSLSIEGNACPHSHTHRRLRRKGWGLLNGDSRREGGIRELHPALSRTL